MLKKKIKIEKLDLPAVVPDERIVGNIYFIRGEKVMFDRDLAVLYGVETKALNRAVRRNIKRFPSDFMFQLNRIEANMFLKFQKGISENDKNLKYQNGTSSWGGARKLPLVFTEQGVAMLSAVLKSERAIDVSIQIVRVFVNMRKLLVTHKELQNKLEKMEKKYDQNFREVFAVIARLIKTDPRDKNTEVIGFH